MQGQLIDDLLDITRIQSGKLSINFSEVNPSEPVSLSMEAVRVLAESKQIVIESEIKIQSEKIWGDGERLQQIVWNLLTNAIKFSAAGGVIQVRVESVEEQGERFVAIKVIDQGKGIRPEFLPKIFERFSQADSSSVRIHGGLGLGLAIVRDLVQLQGGTVWAESEGIDKGATFTALFPIKSGTVGLTSEVSPAEKKTQEEGEPADLTGLRVMVVEDEPRTLEVLTETLNSFGAKTLPCSTVAEALAALEKFKPDVLVSDISMPGEDGYSLLRKIRKLGPGQCGDVPSLALTAYATEGDAKRALSAGFDSHMSKPFDTFRLGHVVAQLAKQLRVERP
jgi:CheY-like chemotaxis protein